MILSWENPSTVRLLNWIPVRKMCTASKKDKGSPGPVFRTPIELPIHTPARR